MLPIRDDAMNRYGKCLLYLAQKDSKVGLTRTEEAPSQQNLS
jgi:hypothetical protein